MRPDQWPAQAALATIGLYQRFVSPHKGFRCAHSVQTGRRGCSALGARAIRRHGLWNGLDVLGGRLDACALSHEELRAVRNKPGLHPQSGLCDFDCGGADCNPFDACDVAECACDAADCLDCFDRRKRCSRNSSADAARERILARQNRRKAPPHLTPPPATAPPKEP